MHYKNGRVAKEGDKVISISLGIAGVLYNVVGNSDSCNGRLALTQSNDPYITLKECLHIEDIKSALIPDSSQKQ